MTNSVIGMTDYLLLKQLIVLKHTTHVCNEDFGV